MLNCLEQLQAVIEEIKKKYPRTELSPDPTNPGYAEYVAKLMGSDEIANCPAYVGRVVGIAETMGCITHVQADEIIAGMDNGRHSEVARELMELGTSGQLQFVIFSVRKGLRAVLKRKPSIVIDKYQDIVWCLQVLQYLLTTRHPERPRSGHISA